MGGLSYLKNVFGIDCQIDLTSIKNTHSTIRIISSAAIPRLAPQLRFVLFLEFGFSVVAKILRACLS